MKPKEQVCSYSQGLGVARNNLIKASKEPYLLFVDCGVTFSRSVFENYIKPAIKHRKLLLYKGENGILCTKVLGLPRWIALRVGGFDESFHIGEDLEFGLKLQNFYKSIPLIKDNIVVIPNNLVDHKQHEERGSYFKSLCVRVRCAIRYRRWDLVKPQRKKDAFGVFALPFLLLIYLFSNRRLNINVK